MLFCRILEGDRHLYNNNMGIFGVGCASYWYGRIAGSGVHLMHEMLGPEMQLLVFADNLETELNQVDGGV